MGGYYARDAFVFMAHSCGVRMMRARPRRSLHALHSTFKCLSNNRKMLF